MWICVKYLIMGKWKSRCQNSNAVLGVPINVIFAYFYICTTCYLWHEDILPDTLTAFSIGCLKEEKLGFYNDYKISVIAQCMALKIFCQRFLGVEISRPCFICTNSSNIIMTHSLWTKSKALHVFRDCRYVFGLKGNFLGVLSIFGNVSCLR